MSDAMNGQFERLLETLADGVVVVEKTGKVLYVNPAAERLLAQGSLLDKTLALPMMASLTEPQEIPVHDSTGTRWLEIRTSEVDWQAHQAFAISFHDISNIKREQRQLRQIASLLDVTSAGVVLTDSEQKIVRVNHAFTKITGFSEPEVVGQSTQMLRSGRHDDNFYDDLWLNVDTTGYWQGEPWSQRKNGEVYPQLLTINQIKNSITRTISILITNRHNYSPRHNAFSIFLKEP